MADGFSSRRVKRARKARKVQLTPAVLEAAALQHLNRFDCTRQRLRAVLERKVAKLQKQLAAAQAEEQSTTPIDPEQVDQWIEQLLTRLCDAGYVNDVRYAEALARNLLERGCAPRQISTKLRLRGVADELAADVVVNLGQSRETELYAASRLVRRRKLGWMRSDEARVLRAQKDLAALARAGFSFETARRALQGPLEGT